MSASSGRPLTGRGVLAIMLGAFGVIVAVNATLAVHATGSFPGLVVENSYVASQQFDERREAVERLGWRTAAAWREGVLVLSVEGADGRPVRGLRVTAALGRPAAALTDRQVKLGAAEGGYSAPADLSPGRWRVAFRIEGAGTPVELISVIRVPERPA